MDRKKDQKIAVFDLGGGTFDVSVLEVGEDGGGAVAVEHLGGRGDAGGVVVGHAV